MPNEQSIQVPIQWEISRELVTQAATNMVVNHTTEGEFFITFFEIRAPIILEGQNDEMRDIDSVKAKAVARVMVTPGRLPGIIAALQENYQTWLAEQSRGETDEQ